MSVHDFSCRRYMYDNCQRTCGKCGRSNCEDQDALCDLYVKAYGCRGTDNFYKWVRDTCSKSCKTCGTAAAATVAAAGQRCVDLSSSCDVFKARFTCKPKLNKAAVWAKANCQATCELCPVTGEWGLGITPDLAPQLCEKQHGGVMHAAAPLAFRERSKRRRAG